jgi:carboxyl-terminal processing protease
LIIIILSSIVSLACYTKAQRNRYASTITEAMHIISSEFVDEVEPRKLFEDAMDGMVESLDQYSTYIHSDDFNQFQATLDQKFGGIGIIVEVNQETKRLTVMSPLVGTPAYKAGMRAGDEILEINGQTTEEISLKEAVNLMRGLPGTPISIKIQHLGEDQPFELTLKRDIIPIESVLGDTRHDDGSWRFVLESHPQIAYVRITTFGEQTVVELKHAFAFDDEEVAALIIDLRSNAGGLLTAAVETCDLFLDSGDIVSTRGRNGVERQSYPAAAGPTIVDPHIPTVILTNKYSASASEIVAACLQDHQRAVIVGQRSWGKGTVQNIIPLENGKSALKLTTATYWRPSGQNIHRKETATEDDAWGVRPNDGFEVILSKEDFDRVIRERRQRDVVRSNEPPPAGGGEKAKPPFDPQLDRAIEHLLEQLKAAPAPRAKA